MINSLRYFVCLVLICILAQACGKSSLVSSQVDSSFKGPISGKVLVVGVFKDPTAHKIFEDSFVAELNKAGVTAIPSYQFGLEHSPPNEKNLKAVMQGTGAAFVLMVHMTADKTSSFDLEPMNTVQVASVYSDGPHNYQTLNYYYSWDPELTITNTEMSMVASLFDGKDSHCVWSARSKSHNLNNYLRKEDVQLEELFIKNMQDHDLL